jgi:hypothetical protein
MSQVAPGIYRARARASAFGTSSKGTKQIAVVFELTGANTTEGRQYVGASLTWYGYFSDKALERTLESLEYAGWNGHDLRDLTSLGSAEVELVVADETNDYTGETRSRVQWVNKLGGIAMKDRMSEGEVAAFAASLQGSVLAWRQRKGQPRSSPNSGVRDPHGPSLRGSPHDPPASLHTPDEPPVDDDIPF